MTSRPSELATHAPSRHTNPFATCWTRPGAIPFRFRDGQGSEQLAAKLAEQGWRGAIIGPHGSGKSTLLESLKPALIAAGRRIHTISLRDGQRRLPYNSFDASKNCLLIIDGYEQLAWLEQILVLHRCRSAGIGLLVTSHATTRLPTLIELSPDRHLVELLVADLCAKVSTAIAPNYVAASHACHGSNVREILFDLYDRHEQQRRRSNTPGELQSR